MNIFNFFTKPDVTPPSNTLEPNFPELDKLTDKYMHYLNNMMDYYDELPEFGRIKLAMDDVLLLNLKSINYFLETQYFTADPYHRHKVEEHLKTYTMYNCFCGWVIGREWAKKDSQLFNKLGHKKKINLNEIPSDAMMLLHNSTYYPYWIFTSIFDDYYKSNIGKRGSNQKEAHYKDTYRSLLNGTIMCFLDGIKSIEKF
jgi:hypothetical protein